MTKPEDDFSKLEITWEFSPDENGDPLIREMTVYGSEPDLKLLQARLDAYGPNESKDSKDDDRLIFQLDQGQQTKLDEWLKIQYANLVEKQKGTSAEMWHVTGDDGIVYPYTGAIGGDCKYSFFPTGLGDVVTVSFNGETIDLSDYESW